MAGNEMHPLSLSGCNLTVAPTFGNHAVVSVAAMNLLQRRHVRGEMQGANIITPGRAVFRQIIICYSAHVSILRQSRAERHHLGVVPCRR